MSLKILVIAFLLAFTVMVLADPFTVKVEVVYQTGKSINGVVIKVEKDGVLIGTYKSPANITLQNPGVYTLTVEGEIVYTRRFTLYLSNTTGTVKLLTAVKTVELQPLTTRKIATALLLSILILATAYLPKKISIVLTAVVLFLLAIILLS